MLDLETGKHVILRELDDMTAKLEATASWDAPVRCAGWTIADLAAHVHRFPDMMSRVLTQMKEGDTEVTPRRPAPPPPRDELLAILHEGRGRLAGVLETLTPADLGNMAPMPFGTLPGFVAWQIAAIEAGMHNNDLDWALGNEKPLPSDLCTAVHMTMGGMLPMLERRAEEKPEEPLGFCVRSPSSTVEVLHRGAGWEHTADPSVPTTVVEGDDSAIALYVMGRIPATHPSLRVTGDAATRFKVFFPGP